LRGLYLEQITTAKKTEYLVKRKGSPRSAEIFQEEKLVSTLEEAEDHVSVLSTLGGTKYSFDPRVDGRMHPFSMTIINGSNATILKIVEHLFSFRNQIYIIGGIPEGKSPKDIARTKYICRLVNFPFEDVDRIDVHVREKLRRHRGMAVGEISGLGLLGHKVVVDEELKEIALPLSVASYLLYSTG
jgi:hypothetical protein